MLRNMYINNALYKRTQEVFFPICSHDVSVLIGHLYESDIVFGIVKAFIVDALG